ncbi:MAG TPA: hypothetical protein VF177_07370 [Anaerolineae bacterium]
MNELSATAILLALFALRFAFPLLLTLGSGRWLNRLYERWQVEG